MHLGTVAEELGPRLTAAARSLGGARPSSEELGPPRHRRGGDRPSSEELGPDGSILPPVIKNKEN